MKKENRDFYSEFKQNIHPVSQDMPHSDPVKVGPQPVSEPVIQPVPIQAVDPIEVKGNGHQEEMPPIENPRENDDRGAEMRRQQEETKRRMDRERKEQNIPGNGYMFNREKEHKMETSIIGSQLQLHAFVTSKIQTKVLNPNWDSLNEPVADMYVEGMLEGLPAIGGKLREQFIALTQFKNQENAQAARGGLFDSGPGV